MGEGKITSAFALAIAALAVLSTVVARADDGGVSGRWLTEKRNGIVLIQPCDNSICGWIDWLKDPIVEGVPAHDAHNPDPKLRKRPICGLPILFGFAHDAADPRRWIEGRIYDPESGDTYHANITVQDANHLRLRGYVGIPLLGESQIWTRMPPDALKCS